MRSLWSIVTVLFLAGLSPAFAADVRGDVKLPRTLGKQPAPDKLRYYWDEWNGFLEPRELDEGAWRDVVVVLTGPGGGPTKAQEWTLRGGDFAPATFAARTNQGVRIINSDGAAHLLHSPQLQLPPLQTAPGQSRQVATPSAGTFAIEDRLYPHVAGYLHVVDNLVQTVPLDELGRFRFQGVDAGAYTVKALYRGEVIAKRKVRVDGESPEPMSLNVARNQSP